MLNWQLMMYKFSKLGHTDLAFVWKTWKCWGIQQQMSEKFQELYKESGKYRENLSGQTVFFGQLPIWGYSNV